ncbi:hypothetical protein SAMN05216577_10577 [Pseudomonas citronellolis]|uniref:Uncharacterized protein n=1 Tax=Pseudomonas citronellolis TaxID=53408 RepID=A0AAQ1KEI1_9PSED|nr:MULTISPECIES: hypothetical protein [Pseudomonas]MCL6687518.1 hypothetical protein [Pseudomonas sp. R3.Fl]MCP1607864.1 hypothetical protein [Pseudomonas citronellolis]MCP1644380.1 hypothetical protein [Pseudomonas citronellolis]MCP1658632.1 hypothetical protein [Pseudomonas citronellolis]MCP1667159.1 hypothetical protein [Pseudomonas citronellolis]
MGRTIIALLTTLLALAGAGCSSQSCDPGQPRSSIDRDTRQQIPRQQIDPRVQSLPRY